MGSRHNRKRVRSRPRNRNPPVGSTINHPHPSSNLLVSSAPPPLAFLPHNPSRSAIHWHEQYARWQDRRRQQQHQQHEEASLAEAHRLRIFGGEAGDEMELCAPMLQVVMDLFNGQLDYEDP